MDSHNYIRSASDQTLCVNFRDAFTFFGVLTLTCPFEESLKYAYKSFSEVVDNLVYFCTLKYKNSSSLTKPFIVTPDVYNAYFQSLGNF